MDDGRLSGSPHVTISSLTLLFRPIQQDSFEGGKVNIKGERRHSERLSALKTLQALTENSAGNRGARKRDKGRDTDFIRCEVWCRAKMVLSTRWSSHKGRSKTDSKNN